MKYKKTVIASIVTCGFILLSGAGLLYLSYVAKATLNLLPPENFTSTYMYPLTTRIIRFAKVNNRLPYNLSELPSLDDFTNKTTDVWGNEINYIVNGTTVTLLSYGKDQKSGGIGNDKDVIGIIETKTAEGIWVDEKDDWKNWKLRPLEDKK